MARGLAQRSVAQRERAMRVGHWPAVVWLTGLSGAGKTTIATGVEQHVLELGGQATVLDGDALRVGLCSDLGFARQDRSEHARRVAEVAKVVALGGSIVIVAMISPFSVDRSRARAIVAQSGIRFIEVFVNAPLEVCEMRDPKHLYERARRGEVGNFTGVSSPYECPASPDLVIDTAVESPAICVDAVSRFVFEWVTCTDQGILVRRPAG